jgi:hypothetical protein
VLAVGLFQIDTYYVDGKLQEKDSKIGRVNEKGQFEHAEMYVSENHSKAT